MWLLISVINLWIIVVNLWYIVTVLMVIWCLLRYVPLIPWRESWPMLVYFISCSGSFGHLFRFVLGLFMFDSMQEENKEKSNVKHLFFGRSVTKREQLSQLSKFKMPCRLPLAPGVQNYII